SLISLHRWQYSRTNSVSFTLFGVVAELDSREKLLFAATKEERHRCAFVEFRDQSVDLIRALGFDRRAAADHRHDDIARLDIATRRAAGVLDDDTALEVEFLLLLVVEVGKNQPHAIGLGFILAGRRAFLRRLDAIVFLEFGDRYHDVFGRTLAPP